MPTVRLGMLKSLCLHPNYSPRSGRTVASFFQFLNIVKHYFETKLGWTLIVSCCTWTENHQLVIRTTKVLILLSPGKNRRGSGEENYVRRYRIDLKLSSKKPDGFWEVVLIPGSHRLDGPIMRRNTIVNIGLTVTAQTWYPRLANSSCAPFHRSCCWDDGEGCVYSFSSRL